VLAVIDPLWLLEGDCDAPGWDELEKDAKANTVDWRLFDRLAWALVRAKEPPTKYVGLVPTRPPDGLYVDAHGNSASIVGQQEVKGPNELVAALGPEAQALLEKLGDPLAVLTRLGRTY
jgi:hypothetical protein